jgi:hypothetical protein
VTERHHLQQAALHRVAAAIPVTWRRARVGRAELDRFLFEPEDVVIAVGQDGLVANTAKYLTGQPVIGINPSTALHPGVLVRHPPEAVADLLAMFGRGGLRCESRTMVKAQLADGQTLIAVNEIFAGHVSHQSARYRIEFGGASERQSSSGVIVSTGTGATGWARSIAEAYAAAVALPGPADAELAFFVREAWPSVATGTTIVAGRIAAGEALTLVSEMNDGGTLFGDGIETDRLELPYGQVAQIGRADQVLQLAA